MLFKNSISGYFYDFGIVIPGPGGELVETKERDGIRVDSWNIFRRWNEERRCIIIHDLAALDDPSPTKPVKVVSARQVIYPGTWGESFSQKIESANPAQLS